MARTVSQAQFERTVDTGVQAHPVTDDYLAVTRRTRATVSPAMAEEFADHCERFARF